MQYWNQFSPGDLNECDPARWRQNRDSGFDNVWVSFAVSTFSVSLGDITNYNDEESLNGGSVV